VAVTHINPYAATGDLMTIKECAALLKETGHPVPGRTLTRWSSRPDVYSERHGKFVYVSWSDVLVLHAEAVDRKG